MEFTIGPESARLMTNSVGFWGVRLRGFSLELQQRLRRMYDFCRDLVSRKAQPCSLFWELGFRQCLGFWGSGCRGLGFRFSVEVTVLGFRHLQFRVFSV